MPPEARFPLLYAVPEATGYWMPGTDLYKTPSLAYLIDQAIDNGAASASDAGVFLGGTPQPGVLLLLVPTYRAERVPPNRIARRESATGVVLAVVDVGMLFAQANRNLPEAGFHVSLLDRRREPMKQQIFAWQSRTGADKLPGDAVLQYVEEFVIARHSWMLKVEAATGWIRANQSGGQPFILPFGLLASGLLVIYLNNLLKRSALAERLAGMHADSIEAQRKVQSWVDKLSMAVEQNPATIYITGLDGRIEYVNDKFVETTGYSREEAVGENPFVLSHGTVGDAIYREMQETLASGLTWYGELQNTRRDGTRYWERAMIAPIKDRDGATTNFVAIKENISELRDVLIRLQETESRFRAAMSVMVEGLAIVGEDGAFLFGNRAAEICLGFPEWGLQGHCLQDIPYELLDGEGAVYAKNEDVMSQAVREGNEQRNRVLGMRSADGKIRWLQINASPLRVGGTQNPGVVMTFSDITERKLAEEQLNLAFAAIRCSGEGILVTDACWRIVSVNPAFEKVTGYCAEEMIGNTPDMIIAIRPEENFRASVQAAMEKSGYWQGEVWNRRKNGETYPEWLGISAVQDADGRAKYYVHIFSDMTERMEAQKRIEFLAHHDPLTELPNRLLLRDRVVQARAQACRTQSRVALMFLDLDRFKTINDSLGHPVGDALLKAVVERLKRCVRESDTVSRQGGDEFVVLLNDIRDGEAVSRVADKIHQSMAEPFVVGAHLLSTSFSIGIALYPDDGDDFDSLLQKADTAMYHAKEAGRNGHRFFTEQMNRQVVENLMLETQLRSALENREFVLHYQPQMDLQEGRIVGVEALIRWNSPEHGMVSPARFIPVAEESGMIVPIGAWVLQEACRQARAWQEGGLPPFTVAVNLSAIQFRRLDLVNTVINALVLSDLDSQWLELELTESILVQDAETTLDTVRRLKALGIKLSVDDFGTGYSSLAYLKRFAVDKLKIDQSFVRDLLEDPDDAAIVRAIIQMAHSLKLKTIAEGVENAELGGMLRLFHCDEIQGYWLARPMPADELEAFVRARQLA